MRIRASMAAMLIALTGCGQGGEGSNAAEANGANASAPAAQAPAANAASPAAAAAPRWDFQSGNGVATIAFLDPAGHAAIRFVCITRPGRLVLNVPAFRPIGSEERLSFGGGGRAVALVAGTSGERRLPGVSASGDVPQDLPALLSGPISASYGAQSTGPHPAPPAQLALAFVDACRAAAATQAPAPAAAAAASPCLMQGSERLAGRPLRAVGTEPFWAARIEGRCVTYSHPEDQAGTRVWTRYAPGPGGGGSWTGALGGRPFVLRTRAQPGCSDGMSDKRYPLAVDLVVGGEHREGCAEPL
jgi:uncharacterized membrane protein